MLKPPTFDQEAALQARGYRLVAGVDEVGRGALAGPVMAAAVIMPLGADFPWLRHVRDSKQLSPAQRERVFDLVQRAGIPFGLGAAPHTAIDEVGIVRATRMAMARAMEALPRRPDYVLIDALSLPEVDLPQKGIIRGDQLSSLDCLRLDRGQGQPGPGDDGVGQRLPGLRTGAPQGLRHPAAPGVPGEAGPLRHPPPVVRSCRGTLPGVNRKALGDMGERWAREYLQNATATSSGRPTSAAAKGEVDIVAQDGDCLVFVEVRTRSGSGVRHSRGVGDRRQAGAGWWRWPCPISSPTVACPRTGASMWWP